MNRLQWRKNNKHQFRSNLLAGLDGADLAYAVQILNGEMLNEAYIEYQRGESMESLRAVYCRESEGEK